MFRTTRAPAAFAALLCVVLGILVCGGTAAASPETVAVVATAPGSAPGCGEGHLRDEGAAGPVVPPRPTGLGELVPVLAADRGPCGIRGTGEDVRGLGQGREPPELVPPSPVELSILRV